MDIKELKNNIETNKLDDSFMIWLLDDSSSSIISNQYIHEIAKNKNLEVKCIDSINDIPDESFIIDNNLYILKVEEWNKPDEHNNCIVICFKTKDKRAIKIPKLESWHVIDFELAKLQGLTKQDIEFFIKPYEDNYWRFMNDMYKIAIFKKEDQRLVLDQMLGDGQFDSITDYKIWDLSNAIIKRDIGLIKNILKVIDYIDIEPLGLAKVLYNNFKTIASIQANPKVTSKDLGISDKQFFVIKKYNCGFYSNQELIYILNLLTNIEYLFKYEELSISNLIDYMICRIVGA